jgi:uncharacterized protein (TIGR03435 family)
MGRKLLVFAAGMAAMTVSNVMGVLSGPRMLAQSSAPVTPKFEVVSIRPCQDPRQRQVPGDTYPPRGNSSPGRLRTGCYPLLDDHGMGLIRSAYADTFTPIDGGPSWIRSAFYDINAIAEGDPSVKKMMGPMMQVLLEDYFKLKIHRKTGEGPVYFLSVARGGAKLHPFAEGSCTPYSTSPPTALPPDQKYCDNLLSSLSPASVEDQGVTLDDFSKQLLAVLDRPVINKTEIAGRFDIHVEFSREGTKVAAMPLMQTIDGPSPTADPTGPPAIFTALQEQLGLKLGSGKGPIEVLVIDHVERPSSN